MNKKTKGVIRVSEKLCFALGTSARTDVFAILQFAKSLHPRLLEKLKIPNRGGWFTKEGNMNAPDRYERFVVPEGMKKWDRNSSISISIRHAHAASMLQSSFCTFLLNRLKYFGIYFEVILCTDDCGKCWMPATSGCNDFLDVCRISPSCVDFFIVWKLGSFDVSCRVAYERDMKVMNAATFTVQREDHTIGNVIRMYDLHALHIL